MGFLESIGRSGGVGQLGGNLLSGAIQVGQLARQGEVLDLQRQQTEMEMKVKKAQLDKLEADKTPIFQDEMLMEADKKGGPNKGKWFSNMLKQFGYMREMTLPDGTKKTYFERGDRDKIVGLVGKSEEYQKAMIYHDYNDIIQVEIPGLEEQSKKAKTPVEKEAIDTKIAEAKAKADKMRVIFRGGIAGEKTEHVPAGSWVKQGDTWTQLPKEEEEWVPDTIMLGGKPVRIRRNVKTGKEEQVSAGPVGGTTVNVGDKLDVEAGKELIKQLPKLKTEALTAQSNITRIDQMNELLDKGLGGKSGQIKAWLAPYAEGMGINIQSLTDAQTYELLATTLGGSMRIEVVGPGPVSEYEQKLLQKVNAGGNAATGAARELLRYYRSAAHSKVLNYNDSVDAMAEYSPAVGKLHKKIDISPVKKQGPRFEILKVE